MAFITSNKCRTCESRWEGVSSDECGECHNKRVDMERRQYFGALDVLTIEERIRKIEEWIYNHKAPSQWPTTYS